MCMGMYLIARITPMSFVDALLDIPHMVFMLSLPGSEFQGCETCCYRPLFQLSIHCMIESLQGYFWGTAWLG